MKRILTIACLSLSLAFPVLAQQNPADQPATKEDVQQYLDAVHSHDMVKQIMDAMSAPLHKMVHEEYLKEQDKLPADFEERVNAMMDEMLRDMPWDDIIQATVPAYQKHFTKGDLAALTAFYSSPTGQKILRELPAVTAESMETMMPLVQQHMAKVTKRIQQEMEAELLRNQKPAAKPAPVVRN